MPVGIVYLVIFVIIVIVAAVFSLCDDEYMRQVKRKSNKKQKTT